MWPYRWEGGLNEPNELPLDPPLPGMFYVLDLARLVPVRKQDQSAALLSDVLVT